MIAQLNVKLKHYSERDIREVNYTNIMKYTDNAMKKIAHKKCVIFKYKYLCYIPSMNKQLKFDKTCN